jgi:flagellar biosynthesis anti-sigma factor FlgM
MRIDSGNVAAAQVQTDWQVTQGSSSPVTAGTQAIGDRTTLSSDIGTMKSLVSQAMQIPDVRQQKVDALRQHIDGGTYRIDTQTLASALMAASSE